tara:strand:+ start:79 stop:297 length:219 start_codon:yes stop_codon:yes gene_type:complete
MTDEETKKYQREWGKRNPECIKRYRQRCAKHRADRRLQSDHHRLTEYWRLRDSFIAANPDHPAVIFPQKIFI